jgi:hypothetical protein
MDRFRLLYKESDCTEEQFLQDFDIWYQFTSVKRFKALEHTASRQDLRPFECHMRKRYELFFRKILNISKPKTKSKSTICSELTLLLTGQNKRFRITDFRDSGSYGVLLSGMTESGERIIIKMYNLSDADGVDPQGEAWYRIPEGRLQTYTRNLALISGILPSIAPEFLGSQVINLHGGVAFGLLFMTDVGDTDLFRALFAGDEAIRAALMRATGAVLRTIHDHGFIHGDAHTKNFVVIDPLHSRVVAVDTDHSSAYVTTKGFEFERSKRFDVAMAIESIENLQMDTPALLQNFAQGYLHTDQNLQGFIREHTLCEGELSIERAHYDRIGRKVVV